MSEQGWHISKTINIGVVFAIVLQTATAIWFFSDLNSRVNTSMALDEKQDVRISALENIVQSQAVTFARMDENIKAILGALERLERQERAR